MPIYKVELEYTDYIEADSPYEAEETFKDNIQNMSYEIGEAVYVHPFPIKNIEDVDKYLRDEIPYGTKTDKTIAQVLAEEASNE